MESDKIIVYNEFSDVSYGTDEKQKFDLIVPKTAEKGLPLMIFVHGGGWKSGSKSDYADDMKRICEKYPICCISVGYRFIGEEMTVTYKDILSDIANGVHTAVKYIEALGLKVTKKAIGGISAGAYNSMMYALDKCKCSPGSFSFILDKSGPCDLTCMECYKGTDELPTNMAFRIYGQLLGFTYDVDGLKNPDVLNNLTDASPFFRLHENAPAFIIAHSKTDQVVPFSCAERLYEKLLSLGVPVDFVDMDGCGHSETIEIVENKINEKLDEYIEKYLL